MGRFASSFHKEYLTNRATPELLKRATIKYKNLRIAVGLIMQVGRKYDS